MQVIDSADIYTDFTGLAKLKAQAKQNSPAAKMEVAQQFEAIFLQMMLKSMRSANIHEGLIENDQTQLYQEMFDQQIALSISSSNSIGLADVIYQQLGGDMDKLNTIKEKTLPWNTLSANTEPVHIVKPKPAPWHDAQSFIQYLYPTAEKVATEINTEAETVLAISALETGWGKHIMRDANGSSFNLFGIKANNGWSGRKVAAMTMEFESGAMVKKREYFRAYTSPEESVVDFARFLKSNPRYQGLLNGSQKPEQFVNQLKKAGYATDPKYEAKVNAVLNSDLMKSSITMAKTLVMDAIKPAEQQPLL